MRLPTTEGTHFWQQFHVSLPFILRLMRRLTSGVGHVFMRQFIKNLLLRNGFDSQAIDASVHPVVQIEWAWGNYRPLAHSGDANAKAQAHPAAHQIPVHQESQNENKPTAKLAYNGTVTDSHKRKYRSVDKLFSRRRVICHLFRFRPSPVHRRFVWFSSIHIAKRILIENIWAKQPMPPEATAVCKSLSLSVRSFPFVRFSSKFSSFIFSCIFSNFFLLLHFRFLLFSWSLRKCCIFLDSMCVCSCFRHSLNPKKSINETEAPNCEADTQLLRVTTTNRNSSKCKHQTPKYRYIWMLHI